MKSFIDKENMNQSNEPIKTKLSPLTSSTLSRHKPLHHQNTPHRPSTAINPATTPPTTTTLPAIQRKRRHAARHRHHINPGIPGLGLGLGCDLKHLPDMDPGQTTDVNISMGLRDFSTNRYHAALKRFDKAIEQQPQQGLSRFLRGLCYDKLNQWESSLDDFTVVCDYGYTSSAKVAPSSSNNGGRKREKYENNAGGATAQSKRRYERALAYFNRGVVWSKMYAFDKAVEDFGRAILCYGQDVDFYYNRALIYRRFGKFEQAQHDYESVRKIEGRQSSKNHRNSSLRPLSAKASFRLPRIASRGGGGGNANADGDDGSSGVRPRSRTKIQLTSLSSISTTTKYPDKATMTQSALTADPKMRTEAQLDHLISESKLMPAFRLFNVEQIRVLFRYLRYKKYPRGTRLFEQNDTIRYHACVWSGAVSLRKGGGGGGQGIPGSSKNDQVDDGSLARELSLGSEIIVGAIKAGQALVETESDSFGWDNTNDGSPSKETSTNAAAKLRNRRRTACVTEDVTELLVLKKEDFGDTMDVFLRKREKDKTIFLGKLAFLKDWKYEKLCRFGEACHEKVFVMGEIIVEQNAPADFLYVIKSGLVSIVRRPGMRHSAAGAGGTTTLSSSTTYRRICITKLCTGDVFGEDAVLHRTSDGKYPSTAICDTNTVVYCCKIETMDYGDWDLNTRALLAEKAVNYVTDAILIQADKERKRRAKVIKRMKKNGG